MARPRGKRKEARISVSFDEQEYASLGALARRHDVSVAWMVRQAVHALIEREQTHPENLELPLIVRAGPQSQVRP
jgi:predicted transcriptional regulator